MFCGKDAFGAALFQARIAGITPSKDRATWIHPEAKVASGAELVRGAVICRNAVVEDGAYVERSVVLEGAYVGRDAGLVDAIIGEGGRVEAGESLAPGAVVAPAAPATNATA